MLKDGKNFGPKQKTVNRPGLAKKRFFKPVTRLGRKIIGRKSAP